MQEEVAQPGKPRRRVRRALAWTAGVLAVLLLASVVGGYFYLKHLDGNIEVIPDDPGRPEVVDPGPEGPLNILMLGVDERVAGGGVSGAGGDLSDTTILLHLSADRSRAYGVSIPRDLVVDRPPCAPKDGSGAELPAEAGAQFNEAFAVGGANCTWRTVEAMTGIGVDHVVVVKFDGFQRMVDALDGVPVCVPEEISDPEREIFVHKGSYDITGDEALDYVRARYGIGDNSDIGRMRRQQAFLAAMTSKASSLGTLVNPVKLVSFLEAVTRSIETDEGLASLGDLRALAGQLKDIGLSNVDFLTMPVVTAPDDINRLAPAPAAPALWRRLRADHPLTADQLAGAVDASQDPGGAPSNGSTSTPKPSPTGTPDDETADDAAERAAADRAAVGLCA